MPLDYRARLFNRRIAVAGPPIMLPAGVVKPILPWSAIGEDGVHAADLAVRVDVTAGTPVSQVVVLVRDEPGGPVAEAVYSGLSIQAGGFQMFPAPAAGAEIHVLGESTAGATVVARVVVATVGC